MAWSRTKISGVKGVGKIDPDDASAIVISSANITDIPIEITVTNKKTFPGAFYFSNFTDFYFHGSGGEGDFNIDTNFSTDGITTWFMDAGSTTT